MKRLLGMAGVVAALGLVTVLPVRAAGIDSGVILRETEKTVPPPLPQRPWSLPQILDPAKPGHEIWVRDFRFQAPRFSEARLKALLAGERGRLVSVAELTQALRRIDAFYAEHHQPAHARMPAQTVRDGVVEVVVEEAGR